MNRVVWKYPLQPGITDLRVPGGSRILHVGPSGYRVGGADGFRYVDTPAVWIEHDRPPSSAQRDLVDHLRLVVIGTGHEVPEHAVPLGSAWCGPFMWHVYELPQ